jgi:hypothetical protein
MVDLLLITALACLVLVLAIRGDARSFQLRAMNERVKALEAVLDDEVERRWAKLSVPATVHFFPKCEGEAKALTDGARSNDEARSLSSTLNHPAKAKWRGLGGSE